MQRTRSYMQVLMVEAWDRWDYGDLNGLDFLQFAKALPDLHEKAVMVGKLFQKLLYSNRTTIHDWISGGYGTTYHDLLEIMSEIPGEAVASIWTMLRELAPYIEVEKGYITKNFWKQTDRHEDCGTYYIMTSKWISRADNLMGQFERELEAYFNEFDPANGDAQNVHLTMSRTEIRNFLRLFEVAGIMDFLTDEELDSLRPLTDRMKEARTKIHTET